VRSVVRGGCGGFGRGAGKLVGVRERGARELAGVRADRVALDSAIGGLFVKKGARGVRARTPGKISVPNGCDGCEQRGCESSLWGVRVLTSEPEVRVQPSHLRSRPSHPLQLRRV